MKIFVQTFRLGAIVHASPTGMQEGTDTQVMADLARHEDTKPGDVFILVDDDTGFMVGCVEADWDRLVSGWGANNLVKYDRAVGSKMSIDMLMRCERLRQDVTPD